MMERLFSLVEPRVHEAVRRRLEAMAEVFGEAGTEVQDEGGRIVARAKGLRRRWLESSILRGAGFGSGNE